MQPSVYDAILPNIHLTLIASTEPVASFFSSSKTRSSRRTDTSGTACRTLVPKMVTRSRNLRPRCVSMLEHWQCSQHRMRTVRRRNYAAHLTVYRGIIEQLEQVEIDAFPTAFVTD
jgi:hypothetical protein